MKKTLLIPCLAVSLVALPALAMPTPSKQKGMQHMSVTTELPKSKKDESFAAPAEPKIESKPEAANIPKALSDAQALKKLDGLTQWPYYTDLLTVGNDTALEDVIHRVTIDPGSVPPKGLFFLAKALSDRKRYEEAAFYFYAAQLRANFDMVRFPPYLPEEKKEKRDARTEDQKGQVPDKPVELVNPHDTISLIALTTGTPVSRWSMADPTRLDTVMAKVRAWDLATPYAYLPDYDVSHAAPFETWPQLLSKARADYFTRVRQIASGLNKVKPNAPTPSFTRPQ